MKKALEQDQRVRTYHQYGVVSMFAANGRQTYSYSMYNNPTSFRAIATSLASEVPAIALNQSTILEFKKAVHTWYLRNCSNAPACVYEFDLVARNDITDGAGSPTQFTATPSSAFNQGLINQGMAATFSLEVDVSPFESFDFTQNYKVAKVKSFILPVGGSTMRRIKTKSFRVPYSKVLDADQFALKGMTRAKFFIVHGHAARTAGPSTTISEANVSFVHISKYVLRNSQDYISDQQKSFLVNILSQANCNTIDYALNPGTAIVSI